MFLFLALFFLYYWYFYHCSIPPLPTPTTPSPTHPDPFQLSFHVIHHYGFRFLLNSTQVWEHTLDTPSYHVHGPSSSIIPRDECYPYVSETKVPATGLGLYRYLKQNPHYTKTGSFEEHSPHAAKQTGDTFYFNCLDRRIVSLEACPSGHLFQNQTCVAVSSCTDKPNGTKLRDPLHASKFIECTNGREFVKQCPAEAPFFYLDKCISETDRAYQCKFLHTTEPIRIDDHTLFVCRQGQAHYEKCPPNTQMFDTNTCESTFCRGEPNHAKVGLAYTFYGPLYYSPGYMECFNEKVWKTVECDKVWDDTLSKGDNLTMLPMVFDGEKCDIPTFCENVKPMHADTLVPVYEFTKDLQNWKWSEYYDRSVGYTCTGTRRKRTLLDPSERISKQFKAEPACQPPSPRLLPIYQEPHHYYDCDQKRVGYCAVHEYFDGQGCKGRPPHAFEYKRIPIFEFDSLNMEAWIPVLESQKQGPPLGHCDSSEFVYVSAYNLCAHTDCQDYLFLSMVPAFSMLLPQHQKAQCTFDTATRHIRKKTVFHGYTYWNQRVLPQDKNWEDTCTFGQKIQTGNFIWDSTVYATCDENEPFIFCPSTHTTRLYARDSMYACEPPLTNTFTLEVVDTHVPFASNEVLSIQEKVPDTLFYLNKKQPLVELALQKEYKVELDTRVNLKTNHPVDVRLRYRQTHPLSVVFEYNDQHLRRTLDFGKKDIFHVRLRRTNHLPMALPTYTPQSHVEDFKTAF